MHWDTETRDIHQEIRSNLRDKAWRSEKNPHHTVLLLKIALAFALFGLAAAALLAWTFWRECHG